MNTKIRTLLILSPIIVFVIGLVFLYATFGDQTRKIPLDDEPSTGSAYVKVIDWTNRRSSGGSYYHIQGIVQNLGPITARDVRVTVKALDNDGGLVLLEQNWYVEPPTLQSLAKGTFAMMLDYDRQIRKFTVSVAWD